MFLYNLTLQPPSTITTAVLGHFTGTPKQQELVVSKHHHLELWLPSSTTGKLTVIHSQPMFCRIRHLATLPMSRISGTKDYLVVGTDLGALSLLEYDPLAQQFAPIQYHEFGRSGLRRLVPGHLVGCDPRGRALIICGVERSKLVYVVSRDQMNQVRIASPLEANRQNTVVFDMVGVDVEYENPIFGSLETTRGEPKQLVYYELDLGLNHVVRKWATQVDSTANRLVSLPGGDDGPSGVLVCSEGSIEYRHSLGTHAGARVSIPRRTDSQQPPLVIAHAVHRMKRGFFILVQSSLGDLYKVVIQYSDNGVSGLTIGYFDSVEPAASLEILKSGFLFVAAADSGSHRLYQFENLGSDPDEMPQVDAFQVHRELSSLILVDEVENAGPMIRTQVLNLTEEESPQIYALGGSAHSSGLRIIRHGLEVAELAISELPGTPESIWTLRRDRSAEYDEFIVVSFSNASLVLSADGDEVEEVTGSGLLTDQPTLALGAVDGGGMVQVTPGAVRHVLASGKVNEWAAEAEAGAESLVCAFVGQRQVVVGYRDRVVYFELDQQRNVLREHSQQLAVDSPVLCLCLSPTSPQQPLAPLLCVGCQDMTVRVYSLDPRHRLEPLSVQAVPHEPSSVCVSRQLDRLMLYVGLQNGLLVRVAVDGSSGDLGDPRTRFLGTHPVRLRTIGQWVMAFSSVPWLSYEMQGQLRISPLSYECLGDAQLVKSPQCPETGGLVSVAGDTLRILAVERLGSVFGHVDIPLELTPRDFVLHGESKHFAIIETSRDHSHHIWRSLIRVLNPFDGETAQLIQLEPNQSAVSLCQVSFGSGPMLAVGCVTNQRLRPRGFDKCHIQLYRWQQADSWKLELVHRTEVDEAPQCLMAFNNQLLAGMGRQLRLYQMGKRQLLRKAQSAVVPHLVTHIRRHPTRPERLFVCDVQESVHLVVYDSSQTFHTVLEDTIPRYVTSLCVLEDGDTVAGGDKFGNLFVLRAPPKLSQMLEMNQAMYETRQKWDSVAEYHVGDIVTSISACQLNRSARPILLLGTLMGSLQAMAPLVSQSDIGFFQALQTHLQQTIAYSHKTYRSAYVPVRNVVDGDLCEGFARLARSEQERIAEALDKSLDDVLKKLEDIKSIYQL